MRHYNKDVKEEDIRKATDKEYALYNTVFLFGEVFGWFEVIRKEVTFLSGRWPTPAVNHIIDALKFQFSGETDVQGKNQVMLWDIMETHPEVQPKYGADKKRPENADALYNAYRKDSGAIAKFDESKFGSNPKFFSKDEKLEAWVRSKKSAFDNFAYKMRQRHKEGGNSEELSDDDVMKAWHENRAEKAKLEELQKAGIFAEQWEETTDRVFQPLLKALDGLKKMVAYVGQSDTVEALEETVSSSKDEVMKISKSVSAEQEKVVAQKLKQIKEAMGTAMSWVSPLAPRAANPIQLVRQEMDTLLEEMSELVAWKREREMEHEAQLRELTECDVAVIPWARYSYCLPGDYDRMQLYAGEMRSMGGVMLQARSSFKPRLHFLIVPPAPALFVTLFSFSTHTVKCTARLALDC